MHKPCENSSTGRSSGPGIIIREPLVREYISQTIVARRKIYVKADYAGSVVNENLLQVTWHICGGAE